MKKLLFIISPLLLTLLFTSNVVSAGEFENKLKGKILLQVEESGEAWYVNPSNEERYFMGRPNDAFNLMRELGIGITNTNLEKIQIGNENLAGVDSDNDGLSDILEDSIGTDKNIKDTDGDGFNDKDEVLSGYNPKGAGKKIDDNFAMSQLGKILLQVENNGEAWYINPENNKRYFLGRPTDAFNLMRKLGLGITNNNIEQITKNSSTITTDSKVIDTSGWMGWRTDMGYQMFIMKDWKSNFSYFSPDSIDFFEDYGHEPNNAAIRILTLVDKDDPTLMPANYATVEYIEFMEKLEKAEEKNPNLVVQINDLKFRKYDLINYKEYNKKSYGNVIILLSPEIISKNGQIRRIAIEWHEYPGGKEIARNNITAFNEITSTLESFFYKDSTVVWKDF